MEAKKNIVQLFLFLFSLSSCSYMKSGRYIVLPRKYSIDELSKIYKIKKWKLIEVNQGKKLLMGSRIFLPSTSGVISGDLSYRPLNIFSFRKMKKKSFFLWPVPSSKIISSNFGKRWGKNHEGIDIVGRKGAYILASASGVVVYSGKGLGGYGNITVIGHSAGFFTIYAHAHKNYTKKGEKVNKGQVIATLGSTGKSTGYHLHFEVRRDSKSINPRKFF